MDLELDEDQQALAGAVRSVLRSAWPPTALRAQIESGTGADELWSEMVSLDWPALCIDERFGGLGFGPIEAMLVHEGCGAVAAPGPLFATAALFAPVVSALATAEQAERWLPDVAAGRKTGTAALGELRCGAGGPSIEAVRTSDGWRLDGTMHSVIEGNEVDHLLVIADAEGAVQPFVIGTDEVTTTVVRSVDATRGLATMACDGLVVGDDAVLGAVGDQSSAEKVQQAVDHGVTCLAADLVGTCATILDLTLDHAREREQFGVKIGSFQSLKHRLADAFIELEAARASVRVASMALAEDDPRGAVAASSAMALAGDGAQRITREGIQVLGGIGFTWEHDMHLYVKRAMSSSVLLGTAEYHRQRVADLLGLVSA